MHILIVDDEPNIRKSLRIALEATKNTVEEAGGVPDALARFDRSPFDLALVDLRLGTDSGFKLLETFTARRPHMPVVIVTAYSSIDNAVDAMRRGAVDYLPKPFTPAQIRAVLERVEQLGSLQSRRGQSHQPIGLDAPEVLLECGDPQVEAVLEQGRRAATTDAPVLIRGESGTGKGVLARPSTSGAGARRRRLSR